MNRIKFFCIASLVCSMSLTTFSQQIEKGFELLEIYKVAEAYRNATDLNFSIEYKYADSAYPNTILEQVNGTYKVKDGKYWVFLDSVEYVQGNQYSLVVYHRDSTIAVREKSIYGTVLQISVIDSLFRNANIDSVNTTELNDSTRSLKAYFNSDSYYSGYDLEYDLNKYLIRKIKYYIKDITDTLNTSGVSLITMTFTNYTETVVDPEYFNEGKFVYRQGSDFYTKPAYTGFNLLVNIAN